MKSIYQRLFDDHELYEDLIFVLSQMLRRLEQGKEKPGDLSGLKDGIVFFNRHAKAYHHPIEEAFLRHLTKQKMVNEVVKLSCKTKHETLEEKTNWLLEQMSNNSNNGDTAKEEVFEAYQHYLDELREHIRLENDILYPRMESVCDEEWDEILQASGLDVDPWLNDDSHDFQQIIKSIQSAVLAPTTDAHRQLKDSEYLGGNVTVEVL